MEGSTGPSGEGLQPRYQLIDIDEIDISPLNVRRTNPDEGIDELASSIDEIGLQQPIVVYEQEDGRYGLIIGQRRFLACKKLGMRKIPALITEVKNETELILKSFSENIHRADLGYRDKMSVATGLLSKLESVDKVAACLGVSPQTVRNYLGYSAVPEKVKEMVDKGKLSAYTATRISRQISEEDRAVKIAEKVVELPRADDRREFIDAAKRNPSESPSKVAEGVRKRKFSRITIHLAPRIAKGLEQACARYQSSKDDITLEALEDWLRKRGFVE